MADESSIETRKVAGAIASMGVDELIFNMAKGIADGQARLDQTCMELAVQMGDAQIEFGKIPGTDEPDLISLIELGFTPNFYQFVDTILEIRVSVSSQYEEEKETLTSEIDTQSQERVAQQQYQDQRSNNYHNYGYGRSWGWGWGSWGHGGYGYGSSGSSSSSSKSSSAEKAKSVKVNTVDASFASKYGYSVEASSLIKTKIVPIPPPQVLEEAVQNAAKERKEWAKRFAILRYTKHLLPAISDSAKEIKSELDLLLGKDTFTAPDFAQAKAFNIGITSLQEEYAKLTNDHWAVIENVKDRRLLDNLFTNLMKGDSQLLNYYDDKGKTKASEASEIEALLKTQVDTIENSIIKMDEIVSRLPLTPEEMAQKDAEAEAQEESNPNS